MPAGYSGTPLPRKLGIKDDARVATIGAPTHFPDLLEPLDERFEEARRLLAIDGGLWVAWPKKSSALDGSRQLPPPGLIYSPSNSASASASLFIVPPSSFGGHRPPLGGWNYEEREN